MKIIFLYLLLTVILELQSVEIFGHRGTRGCFPENTLPAFKAAIEAGADCLELDLLVTKEGEIVIHHDFYLNPELCQTKTGEPLNSRKLILETALQELKSLDAGSKRNPRFPTQATVPGTEIPTLKDLIQLIKTMEHPNAKKVRLNLEIKVNPICRSESCDPNMFAKKVLAIVNDSSFADRVQYSSFDLKVLKAMRALNPKALIGFIFDEEHLLGAWKVDPDEWLPFALKEGAEVKADILSPEHLLLTEEKVKIMHEMGFRVVTWTVNDLKRKDELIEMGVEGIITDYPLNFLR